MKVDEEVVRTKRDPYSRVTLQLTLQLILQITTKITSVWTKTFLTH